VAKEIQNRYSAAYSTYASDDVEFFIINGHFACAETKVEEYWYCNTGTTNTSVLNDAVQNTMTETIGSTSRYGCDNESGFRLLMTVSAIGNVRFVDRSTA
jgi:hypothetical protein